MNIKKVFSALALMMALTLVGCNKSDTPAQSSGSQGGNEQSSVPAGDNFEFPEENPMPVSRNWTAGTPAQNSYGATYTPLNDAAAKKVGVKIALTDYDPDSEGSIDDNGKLPTSAGKSVTYNVKAAKAGLYQMIMKGKVSSSGDSYSFAGSSSRGIKVSVNGDEEQANVYGDRMYDDAGLDHDDFNEFVLAVVILTGGEDSVAFENPYYRIVFDVDSDVVFAEI